VDDEMGRVFAKAISLPSASELGSSRIEPRAHVTTPPLTRGKYWIVVSGEPQGAITMSGAIPARTMPKAGDTLDFEGTPVSYVASPFMMTMEKGALLKKAGTPASKPPVHHHPPAHKPQ